MNLSSSLAYTHDFPRAKHNSRASSVTGKVIVPSISSASAFSRSPGQAGRSHVLRGLLDSPEKFLRLLRALLGGLNAVLDRAKDEGQGDGPGPWLVGASGDAARRPRPHRFPNPDRPKPVRCVIDDLRKTEEGRRIVPDELFAVWTAVDEALAREPRP